MILPDPKLQGDISVEQAIYGRRSVRSFSQKPVSLSFLSQILWAAQGITEEAVGLRSIPSAGALYPIEIYAVTGSGTVEGLEAGTHRYRPAVRPRPDQQKDIRVDLGRASLSQMWLANAGCDHDLLSTHGWGSDQGMRYAMIEAGHAAQNIFLQAHALGLAAGIVGAFIDGDVVRTMDIPAVHEPLLIMPVGYRPEPGAVSHGPPSEPDSDDLKEGSSW